MTLEKWGTQTGFKKGTQGVAGPACDHESRKQILLWTQVKKKKGQIPLKGEVRKRVAGLLEKEGGLRSGKRAPPQPFVLAADKKVGVSFCSIKKKKKGE